MLGTTHATNAVLERRRLKRVAVLRLGAPATRSVPPLMAWPDDLRHAVSAGEAIVGGGCEFDGRELAPFDREAAARFLESVRGTAEAVAVTGVFSPVSAEHERAARDLSLELLGDGVAVSLSHEVGSLGLIERENATVLNAALAGVAQEVAAALEQSLADHGLAPTVYFAQNDGTLMGMDYAIRYPVLTIGSGPANSLRGAAFLTGYADALVADVGGTSTDVGVLVGGFPRESSAAVEIGGIRTNFRMPDVLAVALGGGTRLRNGDGGVTLGPDSVGFELAREALVFGGETPTLTDAAVAAGRAEIGGQRPPGAPGRAPARGTRGRRCPARRRDRPGQGRPRAIDRSSSSAGGPCSCPRRSPASRRYCGPPTTTWRTRSALRSRWRAVAGRPSCNSMETARPRSRLRRRRRATGRCRPALTPRPSRSSNSTRYRWPTSIARPSG